MALLESEPSNVSLLTPLNSTPTISTPNLPFSSLYYWTACVLAPAAPLIHLFGIISNIISIVVFLKAGVKDNVTTLLFSLALSDLTFLSLTAPIASTLIVLQFDGSWVWPFDYLFLYSLPYWPAYTAYDLSAFISVSLGVTRCACVAMPLKFKLVFTKRRTVIIVLMLFVLAVSLRIPVLTIFRVARTKDPITNVTSVYLAAVNRAAMSRINDIMNRGLVIWINYTIMLSCVTILTYKLSKSSKIRQSCQASGDHTAATGLTNKDLQVVKSVVLVCVIFIFSQLPFLLYSMARLVNPELTFSSRMRNLFGVFSRISTTCAYLNASLNIFVYYNYNSKYRTVFLSLMPFTKKC